MGDWWDLAQERLVRSETACQGILVGVCIEVSQYEGFLLAAILEAKHRNGTVSSLHGTSRLAASLSTLRQHQPSHKGVENMTLAGSFDGGAWLCGPRPELWR